MTLPTLLPKVVAALRNAGATEEIIAAAVKTGEEFCDSRPHRGARPRKHAEGPARQRAYRRRCEIRYEIQPPRDNVRNEIPTCCRSWPVTCPSCRAGAVLFGGIGSS